MATEQQIQLTIALLKQAATMSEIRNQTGLDTSSIDRIAKKQGLEKPWIIRKRIREEEKMNLKLIKKNKKISYKKLSFDKDVSKVSIIGVGMITSPGITYRMFKALASKKINIKVISTSEIKISVLVSAKNVKKAVTVLHKEFKLD